MDKLIIKSSEGGMEDIVLNLSPSDVHSQQSKTMINYPTIIDVDWEKFAVDNNKKSFIYDIVQKINYSVQDINNEISCTDSLVVKDIIYRIMLVCWINEALNLLIKNLKSQQTEGFVFDDEDRLKEATDYLFALRSFVVAHPLDTNRHSKFTLDGSKKCVDIRTHEMVELVFGAGKIEAKRFSFDGIKTSTDVQSGDYYLYIYSDEDNYNMGEFFACYLIDLYETAQLHINKLCALEQYLNGLDEVTDD